MPAHGEKAGHDLKRILNSNNDEFDADQAGLQAAIDGLPATGGWVSGPGMHTRIDISTPIIIPDYVTIRDLWLYLEDASNCNMIINSDRIAGNEWITIENCYLDGNKAAQASGNGIDMLGVRHLLIIGCTLIDIDDEAIYFDEIEAYDTDIRIERCYIATPDSNGIRIRDATFVRVIKNIINDGGAVGIYFLNISHYSECSGNSVYSCGADAGIKLSPAIAVVVTGNLLGGNRYGIQIENSYCDSIVANMIYDSDREGILSSGAGYYHCNIIGNYIGNNSKATNNTYDQILVTSYSNVIIGNVMRATLANKARYGINVTGGDNNIIEGNVIRDCQTDGILLNDADGNMVIGNRIVDSAAYAIELDADADFNSIENNYTTGSVTACLRVNNANCNNNMITNNQFEEGDISDIGTGTHAWLNYDPSAGAWITAINPPLTAVADTHQHALP